MRTNSLHYQWWEILDSCEREQIYAWISDLKEKHPNDADVKYIWVESLYWIGKDVLAEQEEPLVINYYSELIKDKNNRKPKEIAKAYIYRGYFKMYAIDRQKDVEKALAILTDLSGKDGEVKFLRIMAEEIHKQGSRKLLYFNLDKRNMFLL